MSPRQMDLFSRGFFILTIIIDIAFIIICIFILLRKKWGVYALGSLLVVQVIVPLFVYKGIPLSSVLPDLIVTGLIIVVLLSLWSDYV